MQLSMSLVSVIAQQLLPSKDNKGRIAAREIMINTPAVANLIRENKIAQIKTVIQTSADDGMLTMDQDLQELVKQEKITQELAKHYASMSPHSRGKSFYLGPAKVWGSAPHELPEIFLRHKPCLRPSVG